ncbi:iron chaperone [Nocardioides sambongensis]|uniref:iron chaperone n=1 Tax=Nocardioides sambongensis TaxID=2589074 RepID=UPI0011288E5F|nr:DUF1801 domain-containing protein [Nocardioides sambongensis]
MSRPTTVEEYLHQLADTVSEQARDRVSELRALALDAVPQATEAIKWGAPAFLHPDGVILVMLSGHKAHAAMAFTPSTKQAFDAELADISTGRSTVRIPYDDPVPADLLTRMIVFRLEEHEVEDVGWM